MSPRNPVLSVLMRLVRTGVRGVVLGIALLWLAPGFAQAVPPVDLTIDVEGSAAGSTTGPLTVQRVALQFANGQGNTTVDRNTPALAVSAHIRYLGNGTLTGRWLVDGRTIATINTPLVFGTDITLHSDATGVALPTFEPGPHKVSLVLDGQGVVIPAVRYFVADGAAPSDLLKLSTDLPMARDRVPTQRLAFGWTATPGFDRFRLEVIRPSATQRPSQPTGTRLGRADTRTAAPLSQRRGPGSLTAPAASATDSAGGTGRASKGNGTPNPADATPAKGRPPGKGQSPATPPGAKDQATTGKAPNRGKGSTTPAITGPQPALTAAGAQVAAGNRPVAPPSRPVLAVETSLDRFRPALTDLARLGTGPFLWRVIGYPAGSGATPVVTPWVPFRVVTPAPGGVYITDLQVQPSSQPALTEPTTNRTTTAPSAPVAVTVTPGQLGYLAVQVENSTLFPQNRLTLELKEGPATLALVGLPDLPPGTRHREWLPWTVPMLGGSGQLSVRVTQAGAQRHSRRLDWNAPTQFGLAGLDFSRRTDHPFLLPTLNVDAQLGLAGICLSLTGSALNLTQQIAQTADRSQLAITRVRSAQAEGQPAQTLTDRSYFTVQRGERITFTGAAEDRGLVGTYLTLFSDCRQAVAAQIADLNDQIAQLTAPTCGGAPPPPDVPAPDMPPPGAGGGPGAPGSGPGAPFGGPPGGVPGGFGGPGGGPLPPPGGFGGRTGGRTGVPTGTPADCATGDLNTLSEQVSALEITQSQFPTGFPMEFLVVRTQADGTPVPGADGLPEIVWRGPAGQLAQGAVSTLTNAEPWPVAETGNYRVTLHDLGPSESVYATLPGGLPPLLTMGGFELEVIAYDTGQTLADNGTLSGTARLTWAGDADQTPITVAFSRLAFRRDGDPLHGQVTLGAATLSGAGVSLSLAGHTVRLTGLHLSAESALADLSIPLPGNLVPAQEVALTGVPILNGGEWLAEHRFADGFPQLGIDQDALTLNLTGATLLADFSPRMGRNNDPEPPQWQGIGLIGGMVRAAIRPHPDNPALGLFPTQDPARSMLFGRAPWLTLSPDGVLTGEEIQVVPVADGLARFGGDAAKRIPLLLPAGFELEIDGGRFGIQSNRVAGISLSGRVMPPGTLASHPLAFQSLTRAFRNGAPSGFTTERITTFLPRFPLDGYTYLPDAARLTLPGKVPTTLPRIDLPTPPALWPATPEAAAQWTGAVVQALSVRSGLLLEGGRLTVPWEAVPAPSWVATGLADSALVQDSLGNAPVVAATPASGRTTTTAMGPPGGGAFLFTSGGVSGTWVRGAESVYRQVGSFTGQLDGAHLTFSLGALTRSRLAGRLLVPYPTRLEIDFTATVDANGQILVAGDGLRLPTPADGLTLDYWRATLHPGADSGPDLPLLFAGDRIRVGQSDLSLDVADAFGGNEFDREGGGHPFTVSLEILPDGQLDNIQTAPAGGLRFLGLPFSPNSNQLAFRRYVGDHRPPPADRAVTPLGLVSLEGTLIFDVFGPRQVQIEHTAMGARVPFVAAATPDGEPYLADSSGVLYVDARLQFVNTFGVPDSTVTSRLPPAGSAPPGSAGAVDPASYTPFKAFIGEGTVRIINALSVNGVAEAGQLADGSRYEKVGVGGGIDVVRATIAGLHGMETVAQLGGGVIAITTGATGVGEEVINLATEAASFTSSVVTTVAASAATGGAASATEVRHLVGNGLSLAASAVDLLKAVYLSSPWDGATDPLTSPAYVGMEISDIILSAANIGVELDQMSPRQVAEVVLQTVQLSLPMLKNMAITPASADQRVDVALDMAQVLVSATLSLVNDGGLNQQEIWLLANRMVAASRSFAALPEVSQLTGAEYLPLALTLAGLSVEVGQNLASGNASLAPMVALTDKLLAMACDQPDLLQPLYAQTPLAAEANNVLAVSHTVFSGLNQPAFTTGTPTPAGVITDLLDPVLGQLAGDAPSAGGCGAAIRYGAVDAEVKALLRLSRQLLSGVVVADGATDLNQALMNWSLDTVQGSFDLLDALNTNRQVDPRIRTAIDDLRAAAATIGPDDTPPVQALKVSAGILPGTRNLIEQAAPGTTAPQVVDVLGALLNSATQMTANGVDNPTLWIDGATQLVTEVQDLTLPKEVHNGLTLTRLALALASEGMAGDASPRQLVRGGTDLLNALLRYLVTGDLVAARAHPVLLAYNGSLRDLGITPVAATGNNDRMITTLKIALALMNTLGGILDQGQATPPVVLALLGDLIDALKPTGTGPLARQSTAARAIPVAFSTPLSTGAALRATARALPVLDLTQPVTDSYPAVLKTLLTEARIGTTDTATRAAIDTALLALTRDPALVVGTTVNRDENGVISEVRQVLRDGTIFSFDAPTLAVSRHYPVGHPAHPGGLDELYILDNADYPDEELSDLTLPVWDQRLTDILLSSRQYRDEAKNQVAYQRTNADASGATGTTIVTEAISYGTFYPMRVLDGPPPAPGQAADQLTGALMEARFHRANPQGGNGWDIEYVRDSGGVKIIPSLTQGVETVRELPNVAYTRLADIPTDGQILSYRGPHPALGAGQTVQYYFQDKDITVWQNRSVDTIAADTNTPVSKVADISISGRLTQRLRVLGDGTVYLYLPQVEALVAHPSGTWELYALPDTPAAGLVVPNPEGAIPLGQLMANGSADGKVTATSGAPLTPQEQTDLGIDNSPDGKVRVAAPSGKALLTRYANGSMVLLQNSYQAIRISGPATVPLVTDFGTFIADTRQSAMDQIHQLYLLGADTYSQATTELTAQGNGTPDPAALDAVTTDIPALLQALETFGREYGSTPAFGGPANPAFFSALDQLLGTPQNTHIANLQTHAGSSNAVAILVSSWEQLAQLRSQATTVETLAASIPIAPGSVPQSWTAPDGNHTLITDPAGHTVEQIVATDGTRTELRSGNGETYRKTVGSGGITVVEITAADGTRYRYQYPQNEPAFQLAIDPAPLASVTPSDPQYAEKTVLLTRFERLRTGLAQSPRDRDMEAMLRLLADAQDQGWIIDGLDEQGLNAIADAMSALVDQQFDLIESATTTGTLMADWLDGRPQRNPLQRVIGYMADAQQFGLVVSDRVSARLGMALRKAYLDLKQQLAAIDINSLAARQPILSRMIAIAVQAHLGLVKPAHIFGEGYTGTGVETLACDQVSDLLNAMQVRLGQPAAVFITADLRELLDLWVLEQSVPCASGVDFMALLQSVLNRSEADRSVIGLYAATLNLDPTTLQQLMGNPGLGMIQPGVSTSSLAAAIQGPDGVAGQQRAIAILQQAVDAIGPADTDAKLRELVHFAKRIERLKTVSAVAGLNISRYRSLENTVNDGIVTGWQGRWNDTVARIAASSPATPPDRATVRPLILLASLAEELNGLLGTPLIDLATHQQALVPVITERHTRLIEAALADGVTGPEITPAMQRLLDFDRLVASINTAWGGAILPSAADTLASYVTTRITLVADDLANLPQTASSAAINAAVAPLAPLPNLIDHLHGPARQSFIDGIQTLFDQAASRATVQPDRWQQSIDIILSLQRQAALLGWSFSAATRTAGPQVTAILDGRYQNALATVQGQPSLSAIRQLIDIWSTAALLGVDYPLPVEATIGPALLSLSEQVMRCLTGTTTGAACTRAHLLTVEQLAAIGSAIGFSRSHVLVGDLETLIANVDLSGSPVVPNLTALVQADAAGRQRAATIIDSLQSPVPVTTDSDRATLRLLQDEALALAALPVGYPSPTPDPLMTVHNTIGNRLTAWAQQLVNGTMVAAPGNGGVPIDTASLVDVANSLASVPPDTLNIAVSQAPAVTTDALAGPAATGRYQVVAAQLAGPFNNGTDNADLALAYLLASRLPNPDKVGGASFRLGYIPALADYLVEGLSLSSPAGATPAVLNLPTSPADLQNLQNLMDPKVLLTQGLGLLNPRRGFSPGIQTATLLQKVLEPLAGSGNPFMTLGLTALAASVDSTASAVADLPQGQVDWVDVMYSAGASLMRDYNPARPGNTTPPPEAFWPGLIGYGMQTAIDLSRAGGPPTDAAARAALSMGSAFMTYPDVAALTDNAPAPVPVLARMVRALLGNTLTYMESNGDGWPIAVARAAGHGAVAPLSQNTVNPDNLGTDTIDWTLDLLKGLDLAQLGQNPTTLLDAMLQPTGIPTLTCMVQDRTRQIIPAPVTLMPFVAIQELTNSPYTASGTPADRPKALIDAAAGMMNLWLSPDSTVPCPTLATPPGQDVPLATLLRSLRDIDPAAPEAGIDLVGRFGLGAVEALAPGSSVSQAMQLIWWGQPNAPAPGTIPASGLRAIAGNVAGNDPAALLTAALDAPRIGGEVIQLLSSDPATGRMMRLLGGGCLDSDLLGPDHCLGGGQNQGTVPNMFLAMLADVRRSILPNLSTDAHANDRHWGFMKTVPVLANAGTGDFAALAGDLARRDKWNQTVTTVSNSPEKALVAAVDIARMGVNLVASLPSGSQASPGADAILAQSVFAPQMGGELFSGVAGGLGRTTPPGGATSDLYFELIGQFVIPAMFKSATQFTYINDGATGWTMAVRSGSGYPRFTEMANKLGVALDVNALAGAITGGLRADLGGWLGVSNNQLYLEVYTAAEAEVGLFKMGSVALNGFVRNFSGGTPQEIANNLEIGLCGDVTVPVMGLELFGVNPQIAGGAFFYKTAQNGGQQVGYGVKLGLDINNVVPPPLLVAPPMIAYDISGDISMNFHADINGPLPTPRGMLSLTQPMGNISGGIASRLGFGGSILGFDAQVGLPVGIQVFGKPGDGEVGFKYQIGEENLPVGWMLMTNKRLLVGAGSFPNPGDRPLDALQLNTGSSIPKRLKKPVGDWGGWTPGPYDSGLFSGDACGVKASLANGLPGRGGPPSGGP